MISRSSGLTVQAIAQFTCSCDGEQVDLPHRIPGVQEFLAERPPTLTC